MALLILEPDTYPLANLLYGREPQDGALKFASHAEILTERSLSAEGVLLSGVENLPLSQQHALGSALRRNPNISRVYNWPSIGPRRFAHLHALQAAGFNKFHVWFGAQVLEANEFPFVLRHVVTGAVLSPVIASREGLLHACGRLQWKLDEVLAVEICVQQARDGLYRKYSCFVVGNTTIPAHLHLGKHWLIRGGNRVSTQEATSEEAEYLKGNPHNEQLCLAASICAVDFARVDYGVIDGRVQVYEFNLTPGSGVPIGQSSRENVIRLALRKALSEL